MEFREYQHIERLNNVEVDGLLIGNCYVFPKIDGTNGSMFLHDDGDIHVTSRRRDLMTREEDNFDFREVFLKNNIAKYKPFFEQYPNYRLFGEYMKPHTLKTYRDEIWNRFWIFDVIEDKGEDYRYLPYDEYSKILDKYQLDYITIQCILENPTSDRLIQEMDKNTWGIEDGKGVGEGIVVKRYDFVNKYGRITWGKMVRNEFKEQNKKEFPSKILKSKNNIEIEVSEKYVTEGRFEKLFSKITSGNGWVNSYIPQMLNRMFYEIVTEEIWHIVKDYKNPVIDFKRLHQCVIEKTKVYLRNRELI